MSFDSGAMPCNVRTSTNDKTDLMRLWGFDPGSKYSFSFLKCREDEVISLADRSPYLLGHLALSVSLSVSSASRVCVALSVFRIAGLREFRSIDPF